MIHTKLLIRRLAYVPWLLAFGLVLGWAGEAQAQAITLTAAPDSVREDSGTTTITIKAVITAAQGSDTFVITSLATNPNLGSRFTIGPMPLITIPKDKTEGTGTFEFTALNKKDSAEGVEPAVTGFDENVAIEIAGASSVVTVNEANFTMTDAHTASGGIRLSFDPASLSEEEGPKAVKVTATLDRRVQKKSVTFGVVVDNEDVNTDATNPDAIIEVAQRDTDYSLTPNSITIPRGKVSGTTTITIDPRDRERETNVAAVKFNLGGSPDSFSAEDDGTTDNLAVVPAEFRITDTPIAKPKGLTADPNEVREEAGPTEITLKVTLEKALPEPASVSFTIKDTGSEIVGPEEIIVAAELVSLPAAYLFASDLGKFFAGTEAAERDVNYTAVFGDLSIPAGATEGTATLTLTPIDNEKKGNERSIALRVIASVGNNQTSVIGVKINDDETLTTNIKLSVDPDTTTVGAGETDIIITGTINGATSEDDRVVTLVLASKGADGATAERDIDFTAALTTLTIPADEITGTTNISVTALTGGDKIVFVKHLSVVPANNEDDDPVGITGVAIKLKDAPAGEVAELGALAFDTDVDIGATPFEFVVGEEREVPVQLPDVKGGAEGDKAYSTTALPAGLEFDEDALTISGTPTAVTEEIIVTYTVIDSAKASVAMTVKLKVNEAPDPTADVEKVELSQSSVREGGDATEILVTAVLAEAAEKEETVIFKIGGAAQRDVDFNGTLDPGKVTIAVGETKASTTLTLTPADNEDIDGNRLLSVTATASGGSASADITIADDETLSDSITLSADPHTVKENAGTVGVVITATLNGQVLKEDAEIIIVVDPASTATREVDYIATYFARLAIPAGAVSGNIALVLSPIADGEAENNEAITLTGTIDSLTVNPATITLEDTEAAPEVEEETPEPEPELVDATPAFSEEAVAASSTAIKGTVGVALTAVVLPGATGDGDLTYSVSANLPAGLSFTPSDVEESMEAEAEESTPTSGGTISGTPTTVGSTTIIYVVIDGDEADPESAALTYTIEIAAPPPPMLDVTSVTSTHESIRESGEATAITLTATLAEASTVDEKVLFTIVGPSDGAAAVRDVDYTATLGGFVTIAAGETQGSTTLTLTPIDNSVADGNRFLGVQATVAAKSGASARTDIKIADDETASTSIALSVNPHTISEGADNTVGTITATLDGKALDADATVSIAIDASAATRDVDYRILFTTPLTISAGQISGSVAFAIDPISDDADEGNETITVTGTIDGLAGGSATITLEDYEMMDGETMVGPLAFAEGTTIGDIGVTAGSPMSAELPEAGGPSDITYSVSELPDSLAFDAATRTLSGIAEAEGSTEVTYTATAGEESVSTTFTITVNPPLSFGDLFGLFNNGGAGKANPAQESVDGVLQIVVGQPYSLTLPAVEGGTPPYTYSLTGLPAGLSFDPDTRTVSGTPTTLSETVVVTYMVTDKSGASQPLPILVAVVAPPLDAPDALVAEDYKGADGAGDQGGFVLLSWDLSEHHDGIDGYRIFRELPVLGNEMVPWAMVDAVPGVDIGRAIVATLDNVATNWGIAAERGGQTTHGAAKAVFVSGNQAYELMAETMMASREAAQAGDAPVFASLLPEALAYAQGVAPKLNLVAGVLQSSEITLTEEPVRATDDIAPLAVPSLSVLDAPNDAGSRILLTWALSPSDQLLQGVIAEAFGPTALEQVVGVHGYGIYRRAAGEDEFVLVAQVDAGITSFVDETALNGVRYTYQVRSYDLDNETGSDLEQTAMAVRNSVLDSEGRALFGLFGVDNRIGFDDFFIFADSFGLTEEDAGFDPAFDLAPNATIDFDDFFVFADNFGRSTAAAGKRVPMLAGLNADARMYLDARTAMPIVGEDFVLDVRVADFAAIKGYGLQVQYEADKLEFVEVLTDQPLGGSELATPQVLADQAGVLTVAAYGDVVSDGEVPLSLVFRAITEIENTVVEIIDNQTYDSEFGFNRLALPAPVQLQTRPEAFALANNYPNPFNPATTIKYALPQAADVQLTVYNVVGQPVRTLVADHQSAGRYVVEWDATNNNGHSLASGMYFYRLQAGEEFLEIKKMLLLK